MRIRTVAMVLGVAATAILLPACGSDSGGGGGGNAGNGGGGGGGGSSQTALGALEATANASSCDSFTPVTVNGTAYPADTAGETPVVINATASPLNCSAGM